MARKTNAEKQAEQQAEREALEAKEAAEYSHRLMKAEVASSTFSSRAAGSSGFFAPLFFVI